MRSVITYDVASAILSGYVSATVLGTISPKIKTSTVAIATAIPTAPSPENDETAIAVITTAIRVFTSVLPISPVVKKLCLFFNISVTRIALLFLRCFKYRMRSLFAPKNAVSEAEKNIEKISNSTSIIICINSVDGGLSFMSFSVLLQVCFVKAISA